MNSRCTFVSRSDRNWQGVFKMRDLADLGQSSSSVNTAVLPQSSKTEENHNTVRRNAEKVKMEGKTHIKTQRGLKTFFSPLLRATERKRDRRQREMAGATRPSCCVIFFSIRQQSFMLCWWRKYRAARDYISNDKVTNAMPCLTIRYTHTHTHTQHSRLHLKPRYTLDCSGQLISPLQVNMQRENV